MQIVMAVDNMSTTTTVASWQDKVNITKERYLSLGHPLVKLVLNKTIHDIHYDYFSDYDGLIMNSVPLILVTHMTVSDS